MASENNAGLLPQYMAELNYLQNAGREFGHNHAEVALALELAPQGSTDPHVQRLIESFAFLTARLQRTYDAQLPEVPATLLDILYPQLVAPIPSMSIAEFHTDPKQSRALAGITVPANTMLFATARGAEDITCRFRTGYPVVLWPVEVADARIEPPTLYRFLEARPEVTRVLRIRLRCQGTRRFNEFAPPSLRFFLRPAAGSREQIYELLFTHLLGIAVAPVPTGAESPEAPPEPQWLSESRLHQVGFGPDEGLLPCPPMSHQAYRLLQEYFTFPDKFYFFDLAPLPAGALGEGTEADLLLLLTKAPHHTVTVNAESFVLGCTPIINLFRRVSEPIRLDHTRLDYPLVADARRYHSTEIHSVERVTRLVDGAGRGQTIHPLFSFRSPDPDDDGQMLYYAHRGQPLLDASDSSEIVLSFVDPALNFGAPVDDTVFAHVMCTNRGLAEQVERGTIFNWEVDLPLSRVSCVMRPTPQIAPPTNAAPLWRLISHLSLNHLSIADGAEGITALREILNLYAPAANTATARLIDGLTRLSTRHIVRHIGADAWRGFCRGIEITLEFDTRSSAASAYLMGSVLSQFFRLYVAVNSFVELVMVTKGDQREETWRWPALTGDAKLL
jgi:type VI secretion system protein ImpG